MSLRYRKISEYTAYGNGSLTFIGNLRQDDKQIDVTLWPGLPPRMRAKENNLDRIIISNNALCHNLDVIGRRHLSTSKHSRYQSGEPI
jgi:hypothetical protein